MELANQNRKSAVAKKATASLEKDFRTFLAQAYLAKLKINPSYSIRAFARYLKISHATLSPLLSGKRVFTRKTISQFGQRLGLSENEIENFCVSLKEKKNELASSTMVEKSYRLLDEDAFLYLKEWYHDGILELVKTKSFKPDHTWIAARLGISVVQAREASSRLQKLGLLQIHENKKWICSSANNTTQLSEVNTSKALREYQKTMIEKSLTALELRPIEERVQSSLMVAIAPKDLPKIREKIKKFRRELDAFVSHDESELDEVYVFLFSGFPLK